jgi:hypothetical protein
LAKKVTTGHKTCSPGREVEDFFTEKGWIFDVDLRLLEGR